MELKVIIDVHDPETGLELDHMGIAAYLKKHGTLKGLLVKRAVIDRNPMIKPVPAIYFNKESGNGT